MLLLSDKPSDKLCSLFILELWECPHSWGVRWVQQGLARAEGR